MKFKIFLSGLAISYLFACFFVFANAENSSKEKNMGSTETPPSVENLIKLLKLEKHIEGGYFRRTYENSSNRKTQTDNGNRYLMTSIYYLLTNKSSVGHWHLNKSDIMHYYHIGGPIEYSLIYPDGQLKQIIMGSHITKGEHFQLEVPGGVWKSSRLLKGNHGYGLISEAVSPGFDYNDMSLGNCDELSEKFPQHKKLVCEQSKKGKNSQ